MTGITQHINHPHSERIVIRDMSDCYTWSFPEFVPFCAKLYYFSTFKDFNAVTPA
jgi:hypothetical protein